MKRIWSSSDITLFIFAGASAEFALNKEVDWLYFTGRLPADPVGRLFSTIQYAQRIIFNDAAGAVRTIDNINHIHQQVEYARGQKIPEAAYKDVLFMLVYYSIAAFELLERKLTAAEKDEVILVFSRIGERMNMHNNPATYQEWTGEYAKHLRKNLIFSAYSKNLFQQYRKHLGAFRYFLLIDIQRMLVSPQVNQLLDLGKPIVADKLIYLYRALRRMRLHRLLIRVMIPRRFRKQFAAMERVNNKIT